MFSELKDKGFEIELHSHAAAILEKDFPDALSELENVLGEIDIPITEIIGSGGGEAKGTQRLRRALAAKAWKKVCFEIKKTINGVEKESVSHEVDHVRAFPDGKLIALEIEWNNKDPFFDRDLENFKRLHADLADPPWQFQNRTGKMAPEHKRLSRYGTMKLDEILAMPVGKLVDDTAHLYLWVPNALLPEGRHVMKAWGFHYKSNIVWHKIRKDGGPDGRGVGFYFRNVTELLLFGVQGKNARTLSPGRSQVNFLATRKREHSRKPDEVYDIIESCSPGPFLELFARGTRKGWKTWGDQSESYVPNWSTYANHSGSQLSLVAAGVDD